MPKWNLSTSCVIAVRGKNKTKAEMMWTDEPPAGADDGAASLLAFSSAAKVSSAAPTFVGFYIAWKLPDSGLFFAVN